MGLFFDGFCGIVSCMHWCAYHQEEHDDNSFAIKANGRLDSWCIEGRREYNRNYSAAKYAPIKNEVEQKRKKSAQATTKICTKCKQRKPLNYFSERGDRPGKFHSRCKACRKVLTRQRNIDYALENMDQLKEKRKTYQASHPRYNAQSGRNRRARLQKVRSESFSNSQIRKRDGDLCFFCGKLVDSNLVYPDPLSESIHHVHPISKFGPNVLQNSVLSHLTCNIENKNKYHTPFDSSWTVRSIDSQEARKIAVDQHYLHRSQNISFAYGLFCNDEIYGMVSFGTTTSWRINCSICPDNPYCVIELNRLWVNDQAPFGAASWFVSRALKLMPARIVVAYADTSIMDTRYGSHHHGGVYRALSFKYAGKTKSRKEWRLPGKSRNVGKIQGSILSEVTAKDRYWTVTGNRKQRKQLQNLSCW